MDTIQKIREERQNLHARLEEVLEREKALHKERADINAELAELDAALRVIERFASDKPPHSEPMGEFIAAALGTSKRDVMLEAVKAVPGERLLSLLRWVDQRYGMRLNAKTAGNLLWHLKNDGLVWRDGQRWFPAKSEAPEEISNGAS